MYEGRFSQIIKSYLNRNVNLQIIFNDEAYIICLNYISEYILHNTTLAKQWDYIGKQKEPRQGARAYFRIENHDLS